jgi:hypothetical protein
MIEALTVPLTRAPPASLGTVCDRIVTARAMHFL